MKLHMNYMKIEGLGYSGCYVKIRFNNKIIGKTSTVKNLSEIHWAEERFVLISETPLVESELSLEGNSQLIYICNFHVISHLLLIYICKLHWNEVFLTTITGSVEFCGSVVIENLDLFEIVTGTQLVATNRTLTRNPYYTSNWNVTGEIEFNVKDSEDTRDSSSSSIMYDLEVIKILQVPSLGHLNASPFAIVKVNDIEIGRTKAIDNNLNPGIPKINPKINIFYPKTVTT